MIIAIASGKGGTGKTTLAVNLAICATGERDTELFDCDVEEPNAHLFVRGRKTEETVVTQPVPEVNQELCVRCGACAKICSFNAIVPCPAQTFVFPELCHSCGGCTLVCPKGAITEIDRRIGVIESFSLGGLKLVHGKLDVGRAMAPPLIRALRKRIRPKALTILDAPPGTACPVTATVSDTDYTVLVTEPTPFGLNDLRLAVDMSRELGLDFGVAVNRADDGNRLVENYCESEGIELLARIPDDRAIAESYSRGEIFSLKLPKYKALFGELLAKITTAAAAAKAEKEAGQ